MSYMNKRQQALCHAIIHTASASAAAVGAGLAQIPGSDNAILTPLQLVMTVSLGRVFGLELSDSAAKAALASAGAAVVGRTVSQLCLGWIPVAGNLINATTAASVTEMLGWMLAEDFARQVCLAA